MKKVFLQIFAICLFAQVSLAQTFDDPSFETSTETEIFAVEEKPVANKITNKQTTFQKVVEKTKEALTPKTVEKPVQKGTASIKRVYRKGQKINPNEDLSVIFLYMEDFKIFKLGSSQTTCSMRFNVLTNLDNILNTIDLKLIWPQIKTTLSFIDVIPNQATYVNYTLMGEGCYSMDKTPNIEVNRCRVKGMSQEQCSSKIRWVK